MEQGQEEQVTKGTLKGFLMKVVDLSITVILVLSLVVLGLKLFVYTPVKVDGDSMMNTLHDGDRLFLNKIEKVNRFDIVVLDAPSDINESKKDKSFYVKRVIGIPGDTVKMENDILYINGKEYTEDYVNRSSKIGRHKGDISELGEGENVTPDFKLSDITQGTEEYVPKGYYLVLGDNRRNSNDSRAFGLIKGESIEGVVDARFMPFNDRKVFNGEDIKADK